METIATTTYELSFLEVLGVLPALLTSGAILLGVASLIRRQRAINTGIAYFLLGIACAGCGTTAWRILEISFPFRPGTDIPIDPIQWYANFGIAWLPIGVVLPGCGIGFALVGLSSFLSRGHAVSGAERENESAEQAVDGNPH